MADIQPMNRVGNQWEDSSPPEGWEEVRGPPTNAPLGPSPQPQPLEQTATASGLLRAYAPDWTAQHPTATSILGTLGDVAQGGGRELISQAGSGDSAGDSEIRGGNSGQGRNSREARR